MDWWDRTVYTQQAVWKKFLFTKHNFEIIWFSGPFWRFCFPECIQIMIRGLFLQRNDQYFKYKIWYWIKICDIYASIIKKILFRSPSGARDARNFQTPWYIESLKPRQDDCHFEDNIFTCIFLNEHVWISIDISLKYVPKGQINNIPALVQIMAWCHPVDKPLSEPMLLNLPMHICVTQPQWVNTLMNWF